MLSKGKSFLDFYEAAIVNPQQLILLSSEIQVAFASVPISIRYKDLSNDLAQKNGWFNEGPLGLEHIELKPEPMQSTRYGAYSITLKKLKFKQCEALSKHTALNQNFIRVELDGIPVLAIPSLEQAVAVCKANGKNELKYVAR